MICRTLKTVSIRDYSEKSTDSLIAVFTSEYVPERAVRTRFYVAEDNGRIADSGAIGPFHGKKDESRLFTVLAALKFEGRR